MRTYLRTPFSVLLLTLSALAASGAPVGTAFTYQGSLSSGTTTANGFYDFSFSLFDAATGGSQLGSTLYSTAQPVTNGHFAVTLDFGNQFGGNALWLAIGVRTNGVPIYTFITPRQRLTPAPYASYAPSAGTAAVATTATGVAPGSITSAALGPGAVTQLGSPGGAFSNAVQVSSSGWVGVGTQSPNAALEVTGGPTILTPHVYDEAVDGSGSFSYLRGVRGVAFSTNLLAVAAYNDNAVTLIDTTPNWLNFCSAIVNGTGAFTNLTGASAVALSGNLLAVAASTANAVTLANVANPTNPAWLSVIRDGVGSFNLLGGASALAFSGNLLAVAAANENAVTLVNVANPSAPTLAGFMQQPYNNFTNLGYPAALAFSGNLLAIAGYWSNAVTLADVSNPANPTVRAVLNPATGFPMLRGPQALAINGSLLAVAAASANAVLLVNVSNPSTPTTIAVIQQGTGASAALQSPTALAFMQWNDRTLLAVTAQLSSSLLIYDVTTPANPVLLGVFTGGQLGLHNLSWPRALCVSAGENLAVAAGGVTLLGLFERQAGLVSDTWVGIGTTLPKAPLDVNGDVLVENADLFQVQAKHLEFGNGAVAAGPDAIAIGSTAKASGICSMALGQNTKASGDQSIALGLNSTATGLYSTALGVGALADGEAATALGKDTHASGVLSTAMGFYTTASGYASTAMGDMSTASGDYSMAAGTRAKAAYQGDFVWADSQWADFTSTANDQFLIRAQGGVGINKNNPATALDVNGTVAATGLNINGTVSATAIGIGTTTPQDGVLDVEGDTHINDHDIFLRAGSDRNHGLGWYGLGKLFANINVDGPVLYGWSGGGLGTLSAGGSLGLSWDSTGRVIVDPGNINTGTVSSASLVFGAGSGEGIASKRTAGGNQYALDFYTMYAVRMSIANNGNVGIGRQPAANRLEVAGNASKDTAGSWLANSDARIKRDIQPVSDPLDKLAQVRLVSFRYTDEYRQQHPLIEDRPYLNVVAQEFLQVFPEYVKESGEKLPNGESILQVDTHPLTIYSAAAVQELNQQVKQQKAEIRSLKERLEALERMIHSQR